MATKLYDGLDSSFLQTDGSIPVSIPNGAVTLGVVSGEVSESISLEGYEKIVVIYENTGPDVSVTYLELLGNQTATATINIVADADASSGYALEIVGACKLVFGTKISYVSTMLKKITVKAKTSAVTADTLSASVVAYKNGTVIDRSGVSSLTDFIKIAIEDNVMTTSYATHVGYVKGVASGYTGYTEPAPTPDTPSVLPDGTDEIALILESTGGTFRIDVISLEEVENSIRDIPDGLMAYNISQDGKITPVEKLTIKPIWDNIVVEGTVTTGTLPAQAIIFGVSHAAFDTAYDNLSTYLNTTITVFASMTTTTDITRTTWDGFWEAYYNERTLLIVSIETATKTISDANVILLANIAADDKLTPDEKRIVNQIMNDITDEKISNDSSADEFGVSKVTYGNKFDALYAYLFADGGAPPNDPPLDDLTTTTNIVRADFNTAFSEYYTARSALLAAIDTERKAEIDDNIARLNTSPQTAIKLNKSTFGGGAVSGNAYIHGLTVDLDEQDIDGRILYTESGESTIVTIPIAVNPITGILNKRSYLIFNGTNTITPSFYDYNQNAYFTITIASESIGVGSDTTDIVLGASASGSNDTYNGMVLKITYNSGVIAYRTINDYVGVSKTAIVDALDDAPTAVDDYEVFDETTTKMVIGWVDRAGGDLTDGLIYDRATTLTEGKKLQLIDTMKYLAEATDSATFETKAVFLGIKSVFQTLASYTAFIVNLYANDATITGAIHSVDVDSYGDTTPGWWIGADAGDSNIPKMQIGDITANHIKWDGSVLSGNVAYDEWDLVVQSDADLALLTTGITTYSRVLITKGTFAVTAQIDLDAHSVEVFIGLGQTSIIDLNYEESIGNAMIECGDDLVDIGNFNLISSTGQTDNDMSIIRFTGVTEFTAHNINIDSFDNKGYGFIITSVTPAYHNLFLCSVSNVYHAFNNTNNSSCIAYSCGSHGFINCNFIENSKSWFNTGSGFYNTNYLSNCTAQENIVDGFYNGVLVSSCVALKNGRYGFNNCNALSSVISQENTNHGFQSCADISASTALDNVDGFNTCDKLTACTSYSNSSDGFKSCDVLSGCYATTNSGNGIDACTYISSTYSISNTGDDWTGNTNIDYDSTNCDQQWVDDNESIAASGHWDIPKGTYTIASEPAFRTEVYSGGAWRGVGGESGGTIQSDGTNMRLVNTNIFIAITAYYRYKP